MNTSIPSILLSHVAWTSSDCDLLMSCMHGDYFIHDTETPFLREAQNVVDNKLAVQLSLGTYEETGIILKQCIENGAISKSLCERLSAIIHRVRSESGMICEPEAVSKKFDLLRLIKDNRQQSIIEMVANNDEEGIRSLGDQLYKEDDEGNTPLYLAVVNHQNDIAKILVHYRANINRRNSQGYTPLHRAVKRGEISAVKHLIRLGADVNLSDRSGDTPLLLALELEDSVIKKEMIKIINDAMNDTESIKKELAHSHTPSVASTYFSAVSKQSQSLSEADFKKLADYMLHWETIRETVSGQTLEVLEALYIQL